MRKERAGLDQGLRYMRRHLQSAIQNGRLDERQATETERRVVAHRLQELDAVLERARTLPALGGHKTEIRAGDMVYLRHKDTIRALTLVNTPDADPMNGKVPVDSRLGQALLGHVPGAQVHLATLDGDLPYEILKIV
jgi:transcription elongation GreA/GreB family factor